MIELVIGGIAVVTPIVALAVQWGMQKAWRKSIEEKIVNIEDDIKDLYKNNDKMNSTLVIVLQELAEIKGYLKGIFSDE